MSFVFVGLYAHTEVHTHFSLSGSIFHLSLNTFNMSLLIALLFSSCHPRDFSLCFHTSISISTAILAVNIMIEQCAF